MLTQARSRLYDELGTLRLDDDLHDDLDEDAYFEKHIAAGEGERGDPFTRVTCTTAAAFTRLFVNSPPSLCKKARTFLYLASILDERTSSKKKGPTHSLERE